MNLLLMEVATNAAEQTAEPTFWQQYSSIFLIIAFVGIFYFILIRPQKKREKKVADMRSNIEVGDGVTTIGGIVGRVVSLKEDTLLIETGTDRTKMRIQRWAVQDVEKLSINE